MDVADDLRLLFSSNNNIAYQALERLRVQSEKDASVYQHFEELAAMLKHDNSYVRTRGLVLIADNIQWDAQGRFEALAPEYCQHITDIKPITARQCLKALKRIIPYKPALWPMLEETLRMANFSHYPASMQPLLEKDRSEAFAILLAQKQEMR